MKFSGYQSNVNVNTNAPHVTMPSNPAAYGSGAGMQAAGKAFGQVAAVVQKKQEENDTQDLMDARNRIMTSLTEQMYNSETGFMTIGYGENAKGLTGKVTDAVRNTYDDVAKDYNGRVQQALKKTMRDNFDNFQRLAASRESSEAVKMKGVRYENGIKTGVQMCGLNYNNDDIIKTQLQTGMVYTTAMGKDLGMTGESVAAKQREMYTSCIGSAVDAAITAGDYGRANNLLSSYKKDMDITKWNSLYQKVKKEKELRDNDRLAKEIAQKAYSNGHFNVNIARNEIDKIYGPDGLDRDSMFNFLESKRGTPYQLGSDGTSATDCGQLVQDAAAAAGYTFNSRAADMQYYQLQQEGGLVSREEAQPGDVVFWHVPGSRWTYTDNPDGDETTAYKGVTHTGIITANGSVMQAGSSGVTEMDIDNYEIVGIGRMRGNYDPERARKVQQLARAYGADWEREDKHAKSEYMESLSEQMQSAGSQAAALNLVEEADLEPKDKLKMENMAKRMYSGNSAGGYQTDYVPDSDVLAGIKYTPQRIQKDTEVIEDYMDRLEVEEKISMSQWQKATRAAQRLRASGNIAPAVENEIAEITSDPAFYSDLTNNVKKYGVRNTIENMVATGVSRTAALFLSLQIDHKFYDHLNDWDNSDRDNTAED